MTPARRAALLRLLEDWEAGQVTPVTEVREWLKSEEGTDGMDLWAISLLGITLTPAGLAAARREKDATPKEDTRDA